LFIILKSVRSWPAAKVAAYWVPKPLADARAKAAEITGAARERREFLRGPLH